MSADHCLPDPALSTLEQYLDYVRLLETVIATLLVKKAKPLNPKDEEFDPDWDAVSYDLPRKDLLTAWDRHAPIVLITEAKDTLKVTVVDEVGVISVSGCGDDEVDELYKKRLLSIPHESIIEMDHNNECFG